MINAISARWTGAVLGLTGVEFESLIIGASVALALTGPGRFSGDRFLPVLRDHELVHGLFALALGVVLAAVVLLLRHRPPSLGLQAAMPVQQDGGMDELDDVLAGVGPRLRELRRERGITLAALAETTGISESTLSRLESGGRRPNLELLLPLARTYGVPLDELVGAPQTGDPRVHLRPVTRGAMTYVPLTRRAGGLHAHKLVIHPSAVEPTLKTHEGYEWIYVLNGRLRLFLGARSLVMAPGEVAEFDTHVPHWLGPDDDRPVELLIIFGPQGERAHLRARPN